MDCVKGVLYWQYLWVVGSGCWFSLYCNEIWFPNSYPIWSKFLLFCIWCKQNPIWIDVMLSKASTMMSYTSHWMNEKLNEKSNHISLIYIREHRLFYIAFGDGRFYVVQNSTYPLIWAFVKLFTPLGVSHKNVSPNSICTDKAKNSVQCLNCSTILSVTKWTLVCNNAQFSYNYVCS